MKVVGSTVHSKLVHVMAEAEYNRLYGSQKKVNMVEGVVINVDLKLLSKGGSNYILFLNKKILTEVSIGPGYI